MPLKEYKETSELTNGEFEDQIRSTIEDRINSPQKPSYHELKNLVRLHAQKLGKETGDEEEMGKGLYMYFFHLLFQKEYQDLVKDMWKTLYDFDQELQQKDQSESIDLESGISRFLNQQLQGVTINWHLIKAILRGDLEIVKTKFLDEDAYYSAIPSKEDKKVRVNNPARRALAEKLEKELGRAIIPKPLPRITVPTDGFGKNERLLFLKIYTYLQSDADILFYSPQWREQIEKFFDDINSFLEGIVADLEKMVKNDKRMAKYRDFLREVIDTYLKPLREYCNTLTAYCSENHLPADILLEPILIKNNLLQQGWKEADIRAIAAKWVRHKKEIKEIINQNMTLFGMPVSDTPVKAIFSEKEQYGKGQWAPQHTGEVPPEVIEEADKLSALVKDNVRDAVGTADTQEIQVQSSPKLEGLGSTDKMLVIAGDEMARQHRGISLAPTVLDLPAYQEEPTPSFTELIRNEDGERIQILLNSKTEHERKEFEEILEEQIKKGFKNLKVVSVEDLEDKALYIALKRDLERIVDTYVVTAPLRRMFFTELIYFFEKITGLETNIEQGRFALFAEIAQKLESGLELPFHFKKRDLKKKDLSNTEFPSPSNIVAANSTFKSFRENETLKEYFEEKELAEAAEDVEREIVFNLLEDQVVNLELISTMFKRCSLADAEILGFRGYLKDLKEEVGVTQAGIKKLGKGILRKFSLDKKGRAKLKNYCSSNQEALNKIWESLLLPIAMSYGKIMFSQEDPKFS